MIKKHPYSLTFIMLKFIISTRLTTTENKTKSFYSSQARRALGDFGVPIAIVICVAASVQVPVYTALLRVPSGLSPTAPRPWLVPMSEEFNSVPLWAAAAMLLPAMMIYIVVFLETHIAE